MEGRADHGKLRESDADEGAAPLRFERGGLSYALAGPEDDLDLQRLLAENPMPGRISLTLERSPSFFLGAAVEGMRHETILVRERDSQVAVGLSSRSVRPAYLNGEVASLGYFSQLRVAEAWRARRGILQGGYALTKRVHDREDVPFYVTTIIEDNLVARRLLEAGLPGFPTYRPRGILATYAMPVWRRRRLELGGLELRAGRLEDLPEIAALLNKEYARYQFAPHWTSEDLEHPERSRDLAPEDFTVACRGGRITGCVSLWDQEGYKQTVIRGYGPPLDRLRPALNLLAPWLGLPRLPAVGERLRHATLAHLAVEGEDPAIARRLLIAAANRSLERGYAYLTLGLAEGHPLSPMVRKGFRHLTYRSVLYVVHWPDGRAAVEALDDRLPHLELAVL